MSRPRVGRVWRLSPPEGDDPLAALAAYLRGKMLAEGWCLLQRADEIELLQLQTVLNRPSNSTLAFSRGRIFTSDWELRWATEGGELSWLALGEAGAPPLPPGWQTAQAPYVWQPGMLIKLCLWGEYRSIPGFLSVPRIPRPLQYPLPTGVTPETGDEVVLLVYQYHRDGIVEFTRCCGLELRHRDTRSEQTAGENRDGQSI